MMLMAAGAMEVLSGFKVRVPSHTAFNIIQWQSLKQDEIESFYQIHMSYFSISHVS